MQEKLRIAVIRQQCNLHTNDKAFQPLHQTCLYAAFNGKIWLTVKRSAPTDSAMHCKDQQSNPKYIMGLLPDTWNTGCACARNAGNDFPATDYKETASYWSRHASRHVRHVHVRVASPLWRENVPGIPGACATYNFTTRGPYWYSWWLKIPRGETGDDLCIKRCGLCSKTCLATVLIRWIFAREKLHERFTASVVFQRKIERIDTVARNVLL